MSLIPANFLANLPASLYPATVSIQKVTASGGATGTYTDITTGISARVVPVRATKDAGMFEVYGPGITHRIMLRGPYGVIPDQSILATTGERYKVLDSTTDGQGVETVVYAALKP